MDSNNSAQSQSAQPHSDPKAERIRRERERLISQLASLKLTTIKARTAYILNLFPETRNSDKELVHTYWRVFQRDIVGDKGVVTAENIRELENPSNIIRARQKIQNEYGMFEAVEPVKEERKRRAREFREIFVIDKPSAPIISLFCDESGKDADYLVVGSVWSYDGLTQARLVRYLSEWKSNNNIRGEFHFADLTRAKLEPAKRFFAEAVSHADTLSFKAVVVRRPGLTRPIEKAVLDMHYQLIHLGLQHEFRTGRLKPPRMLDVYKDKEDGVDDLLLTELKQEITARLKVHFADQAYLNLLEPVDSAGNYLIQLADLFTGSVSRKLNPTQTRNQKDEFADFVFNLLGLDLAPEGVITSNNQDAATVIFLPDAA